MERGDADADILNAIRNHQRSDWRPDLLMVDGVQDANLQSVQYLVDFLRGDTHQVTELWLHYFSLLQPSDGGLNVLCDLLANQTTLSKVNLYGCNFGSEEESSQLLTAVEANSSVTHLDISGIHNLDGVAFGNCISGLLQNTPHLQRLGLGYLEVDALRALQPGLRTNRHLKVLDLGYCHLGDEGIHLLADALVGNTTMETLDICVNDITSNGLDDITRLLESTHGVRKIDFRDNDGIFDNNAATQRFAHALSRNGFLTALAITPDGSPAAEMLIFQALERNHVIESLLLHRATNQGLDQLIVSLPRIKGLKRLNLNHGSFRYCLRNASFLPGLRQNTSLETFQRIQWIRVHARIGFQIKNILNRNRSLHHADLLLAPHQPRTLLPIAAKSGIWCLAFAKMTSSNGQNNEEEEPISTDDDSEYEEEEEDDDNDEDSAADNNVTYSGAAASAIFKVLQARPAILQPLLRRHAAAVITTTAASRNQSGASTATTRQRLHYSRGGGTRTNSMEAVGAAAAATTTTTTGEEERCNKRRRL